MLGQHVEESRALLRRHATTAKHELGDVLAGYAYATCELGLAEATLAFRRVRSDEAEELAGQVVHDPEG